MAIMKTEIINQLSNLFDGYVWYGPTILETINQVRPEAASNHYRDSHSIQELIEHMASWRRFVIEKLNGNHQYEVTEETNFTSSKNLSDSIQKLKATQVELMDAIRKFPEDRLSETVPSREYTFQFMLTGIAQHDLYHLGQIALLNR